MKAYIVGGGMDGLEEVEGVYHLVTADGITWATQWCSSFDEAMKALYTDRAGLKEDWAEKYGEVEVERLGLDSMTFERLAKKQDHFAFTHQTDLADGVYYKVITVKDGKVIKSEARSIAKLGDLLVKAVKDSV